MESMFENIKFSCITQNHSSVTILVYIYIYIYKVNITTESSWDDPDQIYRVHTINLKKMDKLATTINP